MTIYIFRANMEYLKIWEKLVLDKILFGKIYIFHKNLGTFYDYELMILETKTA